MSSLSQHRNEAIRRAIARRARAQGWSEDAEEEARQNKGDISPDEPGDGRIVRKRIRDEEDDQDWSDE